MFIAIDSSYSRAKGVELEKILNAQILGNTRVKGIQINQAVRRTHNGEIIGWDIVPIEEFPKLEKKSKRNKPGQGLERRD